MHFTKDYHRIAAVMYAHRWAYSRNPFFYNYENIGGDCTNFASQCIYTGSQVMNFTPTFGWYYINANEKAPAWTGVEYLYRFLTRSAPSIGPIGRKCSIEEVLPGDIVQLRFGGERFQHSPVIVYADKPRTPADILVAAHSQDADNRPLNTYEYTEARYIHIEGINRP
ncbi:MAG: amidase [Ruminococcaceae bacterium]|nr:amidase [Oscillospiraceae bacterium]